MSLVLLLPSPFVCSFLVKRYLLSFRYIRYARIIAEESETCRRVGNECSVSECQACLLLQCSQGQRGWRQTQAVQTIHFTGYFDKQLRAQMAVTADSFPVVNVRLVKQDEPDMVYYDVGTSILISKDEVLTNYHVVQSFAELSDGDEGTLTVASPGSLGKPVKAKIIKTDPVTDMALLKLDKEIDCPTGRVFKCKG